MWIRVPAEEVRVGDTIKFFDFTEGRPVRSVHKAQKGISIIAESQEGDPIEPRIFCRPGFIILLWIAPGQKRPLDDKKKKRFFFIAKSVFGLQQN